MTPLDSGHERVYRWLLRLYPVEFRARFSDELVQLFSDKLRDARATAAPGGAARAWLRALGDLAVTAASEQVRRDRTVAHSLAASSSTSNRVLGVAGVLGGLVLLAVFLVDIAAELNFFRLILFNLGAMAIVVGVHRRQVSAAPALALVAAVPALLANAWHLAMIVLAEGRTEPIGAGDFGLVYFWASAAMWLTDAWFGIVSLRIGAVARLGALALAIGSVLAFTGMDRLGLNSPDSPTIFGPVALAGIVLNGIGWIVLGLEVAFRRRQTGTVTSASSATAAKSRLR